MLDKLKKFADQAKEKAGPLAEQAKERATELAGKAAPAVSQGIDKAAGSLDKATKGRYSGHIDKVQGVVHDTAQKVGDKAAAGTGPAADLGTTDAVIVEPLPPVVTPVEPDLTAPAATFDVDPGLDSPTAVGEPHPAGDNHQGRPQI